MTELDRVLAGSDAPPPGPEFVAAVMAAVRAETSKPPPLPFPWALAGGTLVGLPLATWWLARLLPDLGPAGDPRLAWIGATLALCALAWAAAQQVVET